MTILTMLVLASMILGGALVGIPMWCWLQAARREAAAWQNTSKCWQATAGAWEQVAESQIRKNAGNERKLKV